MHRPFSLTRLTMSEPLRFDEALAFAQSLGLASQTEWYAWCKEGRRPPNVPFNPHTTYKDGGWQGWVHWLGSSGIKKASKFVSFEQGLAFARSLELANPRDRAKASAWPNVRNVFAPYWVLPVPSQCTHPCHPPSS